MICLSKNFLIEVTIVNHRKTGLMPGTRPVAFFNTVTWSMSKYGIPLNFLIYKFLTAHVKPACRIKPLLRLSVPGVPIISCEAFRFGSKEIENRDGPISQCAVKDTLSFPSARRGFYLLRDDIYLVS